jgi:peptidoglycan hydrolase-like protein with peptidoglycan-binding domain
MCTECCDALYQDKKNIIICPDKISPDLINLLHERLIALGYLEARRKNRYDEVLREALSRFQTDNDLPQTDFLDHETIILLGI